MLSIYTKDDIDDGFLPLQQPAPGCWIHIDQVTAEDLEKISHLTGLEQADLADALDKYEIPRVEKIDDRILVFARHPTLTR